MTSRAGRWELLGRMRDPVPADCWDVLDVARDHERRASALRQAADVLEGLSRLEGWGGQAGPTLAATAAARLADLRRAQTRYAGTATALARYAAAVDSARDLTWSALQDVERAGTDLDEEQLRAAALRVDDAVAGLEVAARAAAMAIRSAAAAWSGGSGVAVEHRGDRAVLEDLADRA